MPVMGRSRARASSEPKKKKELLSGFRRKKKRLYVRLFRYMVYFAIGVTVVVVSYLGYRIHQRAYGALPGKEALQNIQHAQATEVYTRYGTLMGRYHLKNRNNLQYSQIPDHLIDALIATEDARFYEHHGIDTRSLIRVFFKTILLGDRSAGGGSTITQQLAKNLYPRKKEDHLALIGNKIREMIIAWRLEEVYEKDQLIQMYLNTVPYGENTFGIKNAAQLYFNRLPEELSPGQGATLVGMLKGTSLYNPHLHPQKARVRRNVVLSQMAKYGYITATRAEKLQNKPLHTDYTPLDHNNGLAPYLREHLREKLEEWCQAQTAPDGQPYNLYTDGLKVYTTLDADLQRYARQAVLNHLPRLQQRLNQELKGTSRSTRQKLTRNILAGIPAYQEASMADPDSRVNRKKKMEVFTWQGPKQVNMSAVDSVRHYLKMLHAGFMAMDPRNGHILAWVGGIDHRFFKYDHVTSRRQIGSTFKPIVYASALNQGIEPCQYYPNDNLVYQEFDGWSPANANNTYGGVYSLEGALVHSVNTVSVQVLMEAGIDSTIHLASDMGLSGKFPRVPSLALGTKNASVKELVQAYGVFANQGRVATPQLIYKIEDQNGKVLKKFKPAPEQQRILDQKVCEQINMMLQGVVHRGTARSLTHNFQFDGDIAGKTGTTQNHADGWFVGYNPHLVFGGWVGAEYPAIHFKSLRYGQGAATALPLGGYFLQQLQQEHPGTSYLTRFHYSKIDTSSYDCPDYREKAPGLLEKIIDMFKKKPTDNQPEKKKKNFLKRLLDQLKKEDSDPDPGRD